MALGSNFNQNSGNNNSNSVYSANYYSRFRIRNFENNIDLTFGYWNGVLIISIVDPSASRDGHANELAKIFMSPFKSKMLADCVDRILNSNENTAYGVDTGAGESRGLIAIGREMEKIYLLIGKVSKNGEYESAQKFYFNYNSSYIMQFADLENLKFAKEYCNDVEIIQFRDLLNDFARYSNGAHAATAYDLNRYEASRLYSIVRGTMEAVNGKPYQRGDFQQSNRGEGFFNKSSGSSNSGFTQKSNNNRHETVDNIEDDFM